MRGAGAALALAAVLLVFTPASTGLGLGNHGQQDAEPPSPEETPGCTIETERLWTCRWEGQVDPTEGGSVLNVSIPWLRTSMVHVLISFSAPVPYYWQVIDDTVDQPIQEGGSMTGEEEGQAFLDVRAGHAYRFILVLGEGDPFRVPADYQAELHFDILPQEIPAGETAGSYLDPQLADAEGDTEGEAYTDVRAGWFDDPYLDDQIIDAGLHLPRLEELGTPDGEYYLRFRLLWELHGVNYEVGWIRHNESSPRGAVFENVAWGWSCYLYRGGETIHQLQPRINGTHGTLTTRVPLELLGDPADGVPFQEIRSIVEVIPAGGRVSSPNLPTIITPSDPYVQDEATDMLRPFAVGGPEIWAQLRGERLESDQAASPIGIRSLGDRLPWLLAGLFALGALAAVVARRREGDSTQDRLLAYREVLETEVNDGWSDDEIFTKLTGLRSALGISDRQHAKMLATVKTRSGHGTEAALVVGETFLGRYDVKERLGGGGGGTAYLARDTSIGRDVVLKTLRFPGTEDTLDELAAEARSFGAIRHANVVRLLDVERVGDSVVLVMEYVSGGSLEDRLEEGPLPPSRFAALGHDLLNGLAAVHGSGVVHRDVKPANILLDGNGSYLIADFGVATVREEVRQTAMARQGVTDAAQLPPVSGTPVYMSPEQARGQGLDERSDLYSAAMVLYEAWTGEVYLAPRPGERRRELQARAANLRGFDREVDGAPALAAWFERALHPDPRRRFTSADEMLTALTQALPTDP